MPAPSCDVGSAVRAGGGVQQAVRNTYREWQSSMSVNSNVSPLWSRLHSLWRTAGKFQCALEATAP